MRQTDKWDKLQQDIVVLILATVPGATDTNGGWRVNADQFSFELGRSGQSWDIKGIRVTGDINLYCRGMKQSRNPSFVAKDVVEAKAKLERLLGDLKKRHEEAVEANKQSDEAQLARDREREDAFKAFESAGLQPEMANTTIRLKTPTLTLNVTWDSGYKKIWLADEHNIGRDDAQIIAFVNLLRGQK